MDAAHAGSQASCTSCGQEFIVGWIDKTLPLVQPSVLPEGVAVENYGTAVPSKPKVPLGDPALRETSRSRVRPARSLQSAPERLLDRKVGRKCADCGSLMYESEYVS